MAHSPTIEQLKHFVGRRDVFAQQNSEGQYHPVKRRLEAADLSDHLDGVKTYGTYVVLGDKARFLCWDIDTGEQYDVGRIVTTLAELGLNRNEVGIEVSGNKGHHVWVLSRSWLPANDLRRLGRTVAALAEVRCEVFPKQDKVVEGGYGSLVKLPGGKHLVSGRPSEFLSEVPQPMPLDKWEHLIAALPPEPAVSSGENGIHGWGSRPCMAAISQGTSEFRNVALFQAAEALCHSGLTADLAAPLLEVMAERCTPPYPIPSMEALMERAAKSGPVCNQLEGAEFHCGESCILRRRKA